MSHGVITVTETLREALDKDDYYIPFTLTLILLGIQGSTNLMLCALIFVHVKWFCAHACACRIMCA